jgi:hypothetical protein
MSKTIPSRDLRNKKLLADPTCSKCGITKTVDDFQKTGVDYWCNSCRSEYAIRKYHEKRSKLSHHGLKALKAKINKRQNSRRAERLASMPPDELAAYRDRTNNDQAVARFKARDAVYQAYGGYVCSCCGETEPSFLSIDHINNDGAEHKRSNNLRTGQQMYRWLAKNGFPKGFQVLCMNCQWGKRNNNGVCPHSGKV